MGGVEGCVLHERIHNLFLSRREQKLKVREQVKALNEVEQTVREWLNSDAVEGLDRTAKPVFD